MGQQAEKKERKKDRKSNRTRQKNKRGDSKVKLNDSPEIGGGGGKEIRHAEIPDLPLGVLNKIHIPYI